LNFSNSEIKSLPDYLGILSVLGTIQIIDCGIKTIPPSIQKLADNKELRLIRTEDEFYDYQWADGHGEIRPRGR